MLFLIIILFSLSFVSAVEVIETDIGDYTFLKGYNHTSPRGLLIHNFRYYNNVTKSEYSIELIEFNDEKFSSEYLDGWVTVKVNRSGGMLNYSDNIVFVDEHESNLFWRCGSVFVKISERIQKYGTIEDFVASLGKEGSGEFPQQLVEEYLNIYPSDCNAIHCRLHDEEVKERKRLLNEELALINEKLMEKRRLMEEEERGEVIVPVEIRNYTTKIKEIPDEQIEPRADPDVVTINGHEADNEPESEKDSEGKEDLIEILVNWLKTIFPDFLR